MFHKEPSSVSAQRGKLNVKVEKARCGKFISFVCVNALTFINFLIFQKYFICIYFLRCWKKKKNK